MQPIFRTPSNRITTNWIEPQAAELFTTGVSLHSHTSVS